MKIKFLIMATVALAAFALLPLPTRAAGDEFTVTADGQAFSLSQKTIASWRGQISLPAQTSLEGAGASFEQALQNLYALPEASENLDHYQYDPKQIYDYLTAIAQDIDQPVQEPELSIDNNRASVFAPPRDGKTLDLPAGAFALIKALETGEGQLVLDTLVTHPQTPLAATNNLGISELLASGTSTFAGSPNNRRHNIAVGVSKMSGLLIAPGETFSFNKNLGPVEAAEGFLPELVIKGDKGTIPELGGGLCQVSSTTFRAAVNAGLPITERRNHAYAVSYYAPQGTDATIYPGVVDLKFVNDTLAYLLVWPHIEGKNSLIFDFYGTKDGRDIVVKKPLQFDRKPDGSMKATWERVVTKDGVAKTDIFKSVYQSPALFHKQEQFVSATPTATSIAPTPMPVVQ